MINTKFRPLLHISIKIPFVRIRTNLMAENIANGYREYLGLYIGIHKWHWELALYDTHRRIIERNRP